MQSLMNGLRLLLTLLAFAWTIFMDEMIRNRNQRLVVVNAKPLPPGATMRWMSL